MLTKHPKPAYKRIINLSLKGIFLAEAAAFAVSFGVWYRLNTNREFRLYMLKNHNWVLESYYGLGEKIVGQTTREHDLQVWTNEGRL